MAPIIIYSDDTKGNQSKKWNKFDLWAMMFAGLSNEENHHLENIHFMCASNLVSPLEMAEPLVRDFNDLENEGLVTYDAYLGESVLVVAPIICLICDNPRASELLNHLGATTRHYCRMCMVSVKIFVGILIIVKLIFHKRLIRTAIHKGCRTYQDQRVKL